MTFTLNKQIVFKHGTPYHNFHNTNHYQLFLTSFLGVRAYKCSFCPDDFIDNRALKKHTIKVHGQETKGGISKDTDLTKAGSTKMGPFFSQTEAI